MVSLAGAHGAVGVLPVGEAIARFGDVLHLDGIGSNTALVAIAIGEHARHSDRVVNAGNDRGAGGAANARCANACETRRHCHLDGRRPL